MVESINYSVVPLTCQTICTITTAPASAQLPRPLLLMRQHSSAPPTRVSRRVEDLEIKSC